VIFPENFSIVLFCRKNYINITFKSSQLIFIIAKELCPLGSNKNINLYVLFLAKKRSNMSAIYSSCFFFFCITIQQSAVILFIHLHKLLCRLHHKMVNLDPYTSKAYVLFSFLHPRLSACAHA
jgi:hypothetical protein